ncbi:helix-turn-helix domain-containing protein [Bacillus dakarensis]|uniref:helix-turn-helix domain-containing protein n=1 Tax=Robertmurraya dakarensis TaxID=1926278 RepID=UPI0009819C11|nr:helix-turn-helix transcriptional regulator [Bacillus dakarensis]
MNELGNYLKELRGKKSIREVAKEVGISHTYLSTLEKGKDPRTGYGRKPSIETLQKLAIGLNVSYLELLQLVGYL